MVKVATKQIQVIHALLSKINRANDKEFKKNLVNQYSNWRVDSTTGLYYQEANELITDLQKQVGWSPEEITKNDKRRLMMHYAHEMMWELRDGSVDKNRLDGWCVNYGQYHKPLNDHSLGELSYLIVQFEKVYQSFLKAV
jgi:hypothetical protein